MLQFNTLVVNGIPQELKASVEKLDNESFGLDKLSPSQRAEQYDKFCSQKDLYKYLLAVEGSEVIGIVVILKRNIKFQGNQIVLGGLGGVCTALERRKMGVASHLLSLAMAELKKTDADIAYLCTDIAKNGNLYGKLGFKPLERPHTYLGRSGKKYTDHDGMLAPINSPKIFAEVMAEKEPFFIGTGNW